MAGFDGSQADHTAGPTDDTVTPEERAQVSEWGKRIKAGKKFDEKQFKRFKEWREYAKGRQGEDGKAGLVRTNLISSGIESLLPYVYAQNPQIDCPPAESVTPERYRVAKAFGKTLEIVLNHQFASANLKVTAKRTCRRAMTVCIGWVKVSYQRDIRTDPIIQQRLQDAQDNLQRINALTRDIDAADVAAQDMDAKKADLEQMVAALQAQVEITVAEGLALDPLLPEDVLVDPGVRELIDYAQSPWIAHRIWFRPDDAKAVFSLSADDIQPAATFTNRAVDELQSGQKTSSADDPNEPWVACWEIWDRQSNTVKTWIEGMSKWARAPYSPDRVGEQWYPFFPLAFHWIDGERWPLSDVEQWKELQDEYNTTRTSFSEHRRRTIPKTVGRADGISPEDAAKINSAIRQEMVLIDAPSGEPLENLMAQVPYAKIDPALYDTSPIRVDFELVSGVQDAQRGAIAVQKTATEADIEQSGFNSRIGERRDSVETWFGAMAKYAAEMLLLEMTPEQVQRIAGQGAVWPQLSRGEIYDLVSVEVRAGSSGKPNQAREQQQWTQLLPQIMPMVQAYAQAQAAAPNVAEAIRNILGKTFQVFDERMDIDDILPQPAQPAGIPGQPGDLGQAFGIPGQDAQQAQQPQPDPTAQTGQVLPFHTAMGQ